MLHGHFPTWLPIWGGEDFVFFRPVFNFADFSISCGVGLIIFNQKKYFADTVKDEKPVTETANETTHTVANSDPDVETRHED
jgi:signal peptidase II